MEQLLQAAQAVVSRSKRARPGAGQAASSGGQPPGTAASARQWTEEQWTALREAEALRAAGRPNDARSRLASEKLLHRFKNSELVGGDQMGIRRSA